VEIEVTFEINADGIVSVSAKDMETGLKQSINVTASSGLTDEEVKSMVDNSRDYLVERRATEGFDSSRQEAEKIIRELDRMFPKVEEVVTGSEFGQEALSKARDLIAKAKQAITRKDQQQLAETIDTLKRTQKMFKGVLARS